MRSRLTITHGVIILLLTTLFLINELGNQGQLPAWLYKNAFATLTRSAAYVTDLKFFLRGTRKLRAKIVILDIDAASIEELGRWPWPRDIIAFTIDEAFRNGAKTLSLDMFLSEPQELVPVELRKNLEKLNLGALTENYQVDRTLASIITKHRDKLVLAWGTESPCRPSVHYCPVLNPEALSTHPVGHTKFATEMSSADSVFDPSKTSVLSAPTLIGNIPIFNQAALHAGFANAIHDSDGIIRRMSAIAFAAGLPHPSLSLETVRTIFDGKWETVVNHRAQIESLTLRAKNTHPIELPITRSGMLSVNHLGPKGSIPYLSIRDLLSDSNVVEDAYERKLAGMTKAEVLKDAVVLLGASALAIGDLVSTPYDPTIPGVEVHATLVENILSESLLTPSCIGWGLWIILFLSIIGGVVLSVGSKRLEGNQLLLLIAGTLVVISVLDMTLFYLNHNWTTAFLYMEVIGIGLSSFLAKYLQEGKKRAFIRTAFAKYVSPAVVNSIIASPQQLTLGGQKREVTILFSDIRSFTTISETMDARRLSEFLNEYFTLMTEVLFKHGGTLDKFIGDAIMAFWGAPLDQEDQAKRAVTACQEMIKVLGEHEKYFQEKYGVLVRIGIGLHKGEASVGNMGSDKSFNYTAIGDNVNLSSRLEAATKFFGATILTTNTTLQSALNAGAQYLPKRYLGKVVVQGKNESVGVSEIITRNYPREFITSFDRAVECFEAQDFQQARGLFEQAKRSWEKGFPDEPMDKMTQRYLDQTEAFLKSPPKDPSDLFWRAGK